MHCPKVIKQYGKGQKNRLFLANYICGYYSTDMKEYEGYCVVNQYI